MVIPSHETIFADPKMTRPFLVGCGLCIVGLGFSAYAGVPIFLIFLSATFLNSVLWALGAGRVVVLVGSAAVLATTMLILSVLRINSVG